MPEGPKAGGPEQRVSARGRIGAVGWHILSLATLVVTYICASGLRSSPPFQDWCESHGATVILGGAPQPATSGDAGGAEVPAARLRNTSLGTCERLPPIVALVAAPAFRPALPLFVGACRFVLAPLVAVLLSELVRRRRLGASRPSAGSMAFWALAIGLGTPLLPAAVIGGLGPALQITGAFGAAAGLVAASRGWLPAAATMYLLCVAATPYAAPMLVAMLALGTADSAPRLRAGPVPVAAVVLLLLTVLGKTIGPHLPTGSPLGPLALGAVTSDAVSLRLTEALALMPSIVAGPPWLRLSTRGVALWVTTPPLLWIPFLRDLSGAERAMGLACGATFLLGLLDRPGSGGVGFGYPHGLEVVPLLFVLLGRRRPRIDGWLLLATGVGIAVNAVGALGFGRPGLFYDGVFPPGVI